MKQVVAVIPARLGSSRFPGKLLYPLNGKPLLYYGWRQVIKAKRVDRTIIATDSRQIAEAAEAFGAEVIITSKRPHTGTDRVAEAMTGIPARIIINVQGDNVGLSPAAVDRVIEAMLADRSCLYATLARTIKTDADLFDPGLTKVVVDADGRALWFSRFPLPYLQNAQRGTRAGQFRFLGHIGVYFFRPQGLAQYAAWKRTPCERAESLEQLRILENGGKMRVFRTTARTISVDRPADLKKIVGR